MVFMPRVMHFWFILSSLRVQSKPFVIKLDMTSGIKRLNIAV